MCSKHVLTALYVYIYAVSIFMTSFLMMPKNMTGEYFVFISIDSP